MKKYGKYIIAVLIILAGLVSVCFIPISASKLIPTIEANIEEELGIKVHIEHLILRLGPTLKVKTPVMHLLYQDGQKFGQFDNAKFYISWGSILKKSPVVKNICAGNLIIKINSDDKYLTDLLSKLEEKEYETVPDISLKKYNFTYNNKNDGDIYKLEGQNLNINKLLTFKNWKTSVDGSFSINDKKYISYNINFLPKFDFNKNEYSVALDGVLKQLKELDFNSDIVADLKLYKDEDNNIQASGLLNFDNISVLDTENSMPKSFIYLTLWGNRASILSNIYTSNTEKIYVEGMINNSKNAVLDLKVKTDTMRLENLYKKLKFLTEFSSFKDIDYINGKLEANFTLKGDLKKIKSNGYMKIQDANISAGGMKIDKIDANIDFSNNILNITKATGFVNNSPIVAKGSINKNILDLELLMNKIELKHFCPTKYGVKNGLLSIAANLSGTLDNIIHKEIINIDNLKIDNNNYVVSLDSFKIDTNKSNTAYITNFCCDNEYTENIKIPSFRVLFNSENLTIPKINIYMPNSSLLFKGDISNYLNENIAFNGIIEGFVNSKDIKCLKTSSTRYPVRINCYGNKSIQNLQTQILFEKTEYFEEPTLLNLTSKFEKNILKIDDLSISNFNGEFSNDLKSNIKSMKKILISGNIDNPLNDPILKNIRVVVPQQLNLNIYDTLLQLKGDIFINGKPKTPDIVGQLLLLNLYNKDLQTTLTNATIDFNKNQFNINAPVLKVGDSVVNLNANVLLDLSNALIIKNLHIKSKYTNTDTILMYKDIPLNNGLKLVIQDGKYYSEKILANIYGCPLYMSAFSSDIKLDNNLLSLKNISSEMYNGKIVGSLNYNLIDEKFSSNIMARGISAAPIFDIVSPKKDYVSGVMDFDANLQGNLSSMQTVNGPIKFIVHNGRMGTLGKLEHLLYAQNVIADNMLRTSLSIVSKAITLKDTGLFKYFRGDLYVDNGIAKIKMLQSQGPLMSLYIKGQYNTVNNNAQLVVLGRLSDEIISGLGAFGDFSINKLMVMLTGEEAKKYNISVDDLENLPQLTAKNTKEFRSIINGNIESTGSVRLFNWISYSEKSLKQRNLPSSNVAVPSFVDDLPY